MGVIGVGAVEDGGLERVKHAEVEVAVGEGGGGCGDGTEELCGLFPVVARERGSVGIGE